MLQLNPSQLVRFIAPIICISSFGLLSACTNIAQSDPTKSQTVTTSLPQASTLFYGGSILTMQGMSPHYVEALFVKDGKIVFAGDLNQAQKFKQKNTQVINLKRHTLLPGFIDAHSHLNSVGLQQTVANLYPTPDGNVSDIPSLIHELSLWQQKNPDFIKATSGWIIGNGSDDAQLNEKRHPTADDLD
jgi:predicted amidohydrolase YtcJ